MANTVRVTSRQSWLSRIGKSMVGLLIGLVLFVGAFPLLWWNEGRAVHRARSLAEGAKTVSDVPADRVDPGREGTLVHLTGLATTDEVLTDGDFGITAPAIRLVRTAETYQWKEESKSEKRTKFGGSEETVTTYRYTKAWSSRHVDSSSFHEPEGHENPSSLGWESRTVDAGRVTCGAFTLGQNLVSKINRAEPRPAAPGDEAGLRAQGFRVAQGVFYKGADPGNPQVGDVRVRFEVVRPQTVSLVAVQRGSTFEAYRARAGSDILLLQEGEVSAADMFEAAVRANVVTTWLVRLGGFAAMFIGLALVLQPISVIGSVVPAVGKVLGTGFGLLSFVIAAVLSLTVMAFAWLAYRPLMAVSLMALAAGALVLLVRSRRTKAVVVPPPIPPPIPQA